jgi:hypothetical protein
MASPTEKFAERLNAARLRANVRRCEAFIDYAPQVCGITLRPVTLDSYNRLIAFESPFIHGEAIDLAAVLVFIWVHHPEFGQHATAARLRVYRQAYRALHPRCPHLNALLQLACQFPRLRWLARYCRPDASARFTTAVAEIRRLLAEALEDFPKDNSSTEDEEGRPKIAANGPSVALMAQIVHVFAREYRLSPAETSALPLRRVVQLFRECVVASGAKGIGLMHPEEARVWREYLDEPNEPAPAASQ